MGLSGPMVPIRTSLHSLLTGQVFQPKVWVSLQVNKVCKVVSVVRCDRGRDTCHNGCFIVSASEQNVPSSSCC